MSATPLQHCACGCHTLVRGADYVNDYHEYPYSQGQVWQPYTASLPQRVPPEPRDSVEEQSGSYPSLTVADFGGGIPQAHATWLVLFKAGWSHEKIATTYNLPLAEVESVLSAFSRQPLPARRRVLPTVGSDAVAQRNAQGWRNRMRYLAQHEGWSLEMLRQAFPDYSRPCWRRSSRFPIAPWNQPSGARNVRSPSRETID
jgi:hypothetical protein